MRRFILVALTMAVGATFTSAQAQQLQTRIDSLSYAFGMVQSQGLSRFLQQFHQEVLGNDSTQRLNMDLFMKAFNSGVKGEAGLVSADEANKIASTIIKALQ